MYVFLLVIQASSCDVDICLLPGYDEELLDNLACLANCVFPSALLLRFFPPFLHPLLAQVTTILNRIYKRKTVIVLKPYIEQQIDMLENDKIRGEKTVYRDDILTWVIADALRRNEPRDGLVDRICCRVFTVIFAAIETTTLTMSNTVLDLCASDPSLQVWEGLAEEGHRMFSSCAGNAPDQAAVNSLVRADSALKETLRLRTSIKALAMQVTAPGGITLNEGKLRLPKGSRLSVSSWGIHHDEEIYPSASRFDAFRFSRLREGGEGADAATNDNDNKHLMVSASETYLPFGMGRHSCPGRYFAAIELKLFLAYLAVNYDIKLAGERPAFVSIGHFPIPPLSGKLMIRRKRGTVAVGVEDPTRE
jgi:cytochrome P450